jgi:hypothetical protein
MTAKKHIYIYEVHVICQVLPQKLYSWHIFEQNHNKTIQFGKGFQQLTNHWHGHDIVGCHGSHWRLSFSTARSWPAHWWPRQRARMPRFSDWPIIFLTSMLFFLLFSMMMVVMLFFTWFPSFFYIFSCCCGCSRIGSSRSVLPKYSLERNCL